MKILFISHSYPPTLGGVESQNFDLSKSLSDIADVKIIANKKGKVFLPLFVVLATIQSLLNAKKYDVCLLGSGVLAPVGAFLKIFFPKKRFFCVVHGLDVTYANRTGFLPTIYRLININALKRLNQLFMVGNATIKEAVKVGVDHSLCTFIPNGVFKEKLICERTRKDLEKLLERDLSNKRVVLRLGRFVPHKGTSWFLNNIVSKLPSDCIFVAAGSRVNKRTAGDKDDFRTCEEIIVEQKLEDRAILLPSLPWEDVKTLLSTVDLVVSPNIKVPGTMEGFGINVIEAAICQRVVIASNLEGLADAVSDGKSGFLVEPENVKAWEEKVFEILEKEPSFFKNFGKQASDHIKEHNTWGKIAKQYLAEMKKY